MHKILVVDDDPDLRLVAETCLSEAGYQTVTAADGDSGLRLARSERPHLILVDLMMPGTHGFAVIQEVRRDLSLRGMRIIVASAKAYPADIRKAKELGADDYIVKPYDPKELLEKIRAALGPDAADIYIKFWGTRGSIPTPGRWMLRYGGDTSCVEVRCGERLLMIDCGSGARRMGLSLAREFAGRELDLHLFVSHTHWDHIHGFPFFTPAYLPTSQITVYSLHGADKSLEKVFTGQMDASYFPVSLSDLPSRLQFVELKEDVGLGEVRISHFQLNHPGLAVAFCIEFGGKRVVYMADHEPYWRLTGDNEQNRRRDHEIDDFARGADVYIREAQYTDEEYSVKRGWGHSTWKDALNSAQQAAVKQLLLYHHDPMHDDDSMDGIVAQCRSFMNEHGMSFKFLAAYDGLELRL